MGNYAYKKEEAERYNKARAEEKARRIAFEKDRLENPEKYARKRNSRVSSLGVFVSAALVLNADALTQRAKRKVI